MSFLLAAFCREWGYACIKNICHWIKIKKKKLKSLLCRKRLGHLERTSPWASGKIAGQKEFQSLLFFYVAMWSVTASLGLLNWWFLRSHSVKKKKDCMLPEDRGWEGAAFSAHCLAWGWAMTDPPKHPSWLHNRESCGQRLQTLGQKEPWALWQLFLLGLERHPRGGRKWRSWEARKASWRDLFPSPFSSHPHQERAGWCVVPWQLHFLGRTDL